MHRFTSVLLFTLALGSAHAQIPSGNATALTVNKTSGAIVETGNITAANFRANNGIPASTNGTLTNATLTGNVQIAAGNGSSISATGTGTIVATSANSVAAGNVTGVLAGANGGTGVANIGKTLTLGGNLTTSGASNLTITTTGITSVTLPTSGTLVGSADTGTVSNTMLAGSIANAKLANSTITIAGTSTALGGSITLDTITGVSGNGLLKRTGANTLAAAISGTDYAPATSGSSILYGNGSGGFSAVTVGGNLSFTGGTLNLGATPNIQAATGTSLALSANATVGGNLVVTASSALNGNGNPIKGTITNDNAATGYVGEYVSSTIAIGSAVPLTTSAAAYNVTSISLTAGDWNVHGVVHFTGTPTGGISTSTSISQTSATLSGSSMSAYSPTVPTASENYSLSPGMVRISLASTTTIYLVARGVFSGGSMSAFGNIAARRVR